MTAIWLAPLILCLLVLLWFRVQRAWIASMEEPEDADALLRPGACGNACRCAPPPADAYMDEDEMEARS